MQYNKLGIFYAFIFLSLVIYAEKLSAQVYTGKIVDQKDRPVPYATIFIEENKTGTISNVQGDFQIQLDKGTYHITIRSLGFLQHVETVTVNSDSLKAKIVLQAQEFEIKEVKIFPGKEDPAYFIIRKAIAKAQYYRGKIKHYEANLYVKSNFVFTNIPKLYQNKIEIEGKKLKDVFKEDVTYVIESQNIITFDYPQKYEQKVISKKTSLVGFNEPPVMGLITSSFYEERPNQVISPLSSLALKHYKFVYEGFVSAGDFDVFKIKVTPKRTSDELVEGYIYIVDGLWCIYMVDFNSRFEFFKYRIKQQYQNLGNSNWLPVSHLIEGNVSMLGLKGNFYYGASLKYDAIEDNLIADNYPVQEEQKTEDSVPVKKEISNKQKEFRKEVVALNTKEELTDNDVKKIARLNRKILKEQYKNSTIEIPTYSNYQIKDDKDSLRNDSVLWDTIRAIPLTRAEIASYQYTDSLVAMESQTADSASIKKKPKSMFKKLISGHYDFVKDSLIRLGYDGLISTENFDFNAVDGYKYRQQIRLTFNPDSGKYISLKPEIGYAFNRKAIFSSLEGRFRNILWNNNNLILNIGKESRDFKPASIGIKPAVNAISTWFFAENFMKLYETSFLQFTMSQRLKKNFYLYADLDYNSFSPLQNNTTYVFSNKKEFSPNIPKGFILVGPELAGQKSFTYSLGANFRKQQRKPWLEKSDFLFMSDFFTANFRFKQGIKNVFTSVSDFSQIDFGFHQQANISPSAGIDWQIKAGYFFNASQMHFSQFKHFKTSEILVPFQSFGKTFQLLNDYEFSTNKSYLNVGAEFRSEYLLLRYLSFLNQRTWSESLHFNYVSTPALKNYWEAGYSLNSLFFAGNVGVFTGFKGNKFERVAVKISISGFE